ncbi:hypothetical protein PLESTB_000522900 [Pleodorina starrii]|uniref:Uncharacterized protein n=1 Tax=Pleodorina starrii TaxID=330485 RepID=A0A9W6F0B0_9CHLO|nr:hypothetical protein PLESTM_000386400 [Pleodorina starrii]GLC51627.1 hypothetical protein PLESTB_000522900 [Pleodorina starrii]
MDPGAVGDAAKAQHQQVLTAEALQAALAALLPGAPSGAAQLLSISAQHPQLGQVLVPVQTEQPNSSKQLAKRKGGRTPEETAGAGPPRPPPIKHEVYEDLEEKFNQLQSEREPKRHRGNPKGYQIKSFCKNPACGKQLNGGRTNRCEHCGFDLASHRRNSQLERLIKSGPLTQSQVRTSLRDAANEVHVRTGGKAVVLTLVYIEGGGPAPAQAIAYGKPAAAFVEARKELITSFEAACREHFKEPQAAGVPPQQQPHQHPHHAGAASQQQQQHHQHQLGIPPLLGPQSDPAASTAAAGSSTAASAAAPPRPCTLGPSSQLLSAVNAAAAAAAAAATAGPGGLPGPPTGAATAATAAAAAPPPPVDLDSVIAATLSDPAAAIARCCEARVSGDVLARLPQTMQLTVLMQAGLLAGEAASVVVELESRQRLQQLPALSLASLSHQLSQQQQLPPHQPQQVPAAPAAALIPALQQQQQQQHPMAPAAPRPAPAAQHWVPGVGGGAVGSAASQDAVPGPYHTAASGGLVPTGAAAAAAAAAAVHGGGMPLLGPLQAAIMAAAAAGAGADGVLGQGVGAASAAAGGPGLGQQLPGLMAVAQQGTPTGAAELPDFGTVQHQGLSQPGVGHQMQAPGQQAAGPVQPHL